MTNAITAVNLSKTFTAPDGKPFAALDNISLNIEAGKLTALVGPDGAGKTTLMRLITGLLSADNGELNVLGCNPARQAQMVQNRISYMPQKFGLYEDLSIAENLNLYADLHGVPQDVRRERFARLLAITDLANYQSRQAGKLSGGMKQKLGLACTLVRTPDLLLLDEPSVGVDPLSRRDLWQIITQLIAEEPLTVLISTAYMDEAAACDTVHILNQGQLLASGTPQALTDRADGLTWQTEPPAGTAARTLQAQLFDDKHNIIDAVPKGGGVRFITRADADLAALQQRLPTPMHARKPELEDTFMMLLNAQQNEENAVITAADAPSLHAGGGSGQDSIVIRVKDLVRTFGNFTAVNSTSFDVHRGEIFGLLGPNGAGKTTTFRMLCGLLPASSGELEVAGVNLRTARAEARRNIGYVAQKFSLYGNLSCAENLRFFGGAYGLSGKALEQRIQELCEQFELNPKAESGILPTGFKQRLAMAAGLIHRPPILFLDEPTSGIDPLARRAFWRTITALAEGGTTIIITTHFMEEAEYCDRILIQDRGTRLALGTPAEIRRETGTDGDMNDAFIAIVEQSREQPHEP